MVHSATIKAGALCILLGFVWSCLAAGRHQAHSTETVVTHTTASARVSMLRRGRQEAATSDSPLQQAGLQSSRPSLCHPSQLSPSLTVQLSRHSRTSLT